MDTKKRRPVAIAVSTLLLAAALAGCTSAPTGTADGSAATDSPAASAQSNLGQVPGPLDTIEGSAEDIIDRLPASDWSTIQQDVADMTDAWGQYSAQASADGATQAQSDAMNAALEALAKAVDAKDETATEQAANDASFAVVDLFALYNPAIPADIGRLDAQERQVIIDSKAGDFSAAQSTMDSIQATWTQVKPQVLAAGGSDAANAFESSLQTQQEGITAHDAAPVVTEAAAGLEIVDQLEQVF